MSNSKTSIMSQTLTKLMLPRVAVLTDQLRGIELDKTENCYRYIEQVPNNTNLVVVGKEHYNETVRVMPIKNSGEVHKVMQLEVSAADGLMLYKVGPYEDGKRQVTIWTMDKALFANYQVKPFYIVPESLLLTQQFQGVSAIERQGNEYWFIEHQGKLLSAKKQGLIANQMMFLASAGLSEQTETRQLSQTDYLAELVVSLPMVMLQYHRGLKSQLQSLTSIDWLSHLKYSGSAALLLVFGYLGLTSLYLNARLDSALAATEQTRAQTSEIFGLKRQLDSIQEKSQQLSDYIAQPSAPSIIWRFLSPLAEQGVTIEQISMLPNGLFIIRFEAKKATDVLNFISKDPAVIEAKFNGQNAVADGVEVFAIDFRLKEPS